MDGYKTRRLKSKLEKMLPKLVPPSWCYQSCSNHGRCWKLPRKQEFCECEPSYTGMFCEESIVFDYWWFWLSIGISISVLLMLPILWCYGIRNDKKAQRKLSESASSGSISTQSSFSTRSSKYLLV